MSGAIKAATAASQGIARGRPGVGNTSVRQVPVMGDYRYMGDPGFFGDLWGGIKGAVGGALTGNPLNIIGGAIGGFSGQRDSVLTATPQLPPMMTMPISVAPRPQQNGQVKTPGFIGGMERLVPGGATGYMDDPEAQRAGRASSAGYHWNKSGYFLKTGEWVRPGSKEVKNRRRNPLNPRALDRSISRITSAKRASKKLSRITVRAKTCK